MLDAEYLLHLTEAAEDIAAQLHNEIIKRIVERVVARIKAGKDYLLTASDKYQIELLQDAGFLRSDIEKEIAQLTKKELTEMKAAFEDAGIESFSYDSDIYRQVGIEPGFLQQSPQLIRLLQRGYEATAGTWENLCRTTADAAQQTFIRECDKVYNLVSTGAVSHTDAYIKAIDTIATDGVVITYPSGHRDTIETATLRCMRTGVAQACAEITDARMDEYNWDIVLVSAHLGARYTAAEDFTNHEWWQGKFYSRSGTDDRFPPLSVCGLGNVQGLCGANCRHSYGPGDGVNNPFEGLIDSAENRRLYDLSQKQRAMERRIRKSKRELVGMKAGVDGAPTPEAKEKLQAMYDQKALKLKRQNEAYRDFCEKNGLKTREQRIATAQFDREQGKAARAAAKRAESAELAGSMKKAPTTSVSADNKPKTGTGTTDHSENKAQANYRYIQPNEWYPDAKPNSHEVERLDSYTDKNGVTYTISPDNHNVQNNPLPNEIRVANLLKEKVGGEVGHVPKVNVPQGVHSPDFKFNGNYYELKTLNQNADGRTLFNRAQRGAKQCDRLIFDISKTSLSGNDIDIQISNIFSSVNTNNIEEIIFIRDDVIEIIAKRNKKE